MKWFTVLAAIRRSPNGFGLDRGNTGSLFALDLSSGVQTPLAPGVGFPKTFGFAHGYGNVVWYGRTARTSFAGPCATLCVLSQPCTFGEESLNGSRGGEACGASRLAVGGDRTGGTTRGSFGA